jgi:hypothetical protein
VEVFERTAARLLGVTVRARGAEWQDDRLVEAAP